MSKVSRIYFDRLRDEHVDPKMIEIWSSSHDEYMKSYHRLKNELDQLIVDLEYKYANLIKKLPLGERHLIIPLREFRSTFDFNAYGFPSLHALIQHQMRPLKVKLISNNSVELSW